MAKSKSFIKLCEQHEVDPKLIPEITSFEDACKAQNLNPDNLPDVADLPAKYQNRLIADYKISVIADALREGKDVDYNDLSYKYFAVFYVEPTDKNSPGSGFGLSYAVCGHWASYSGVGVRLCFPNRDLAVYFGKQFLELHKDHHLYT